MPAVMQSYVVGSDVISAIDIYNLKEDSETVIGQASATYTGQSESSGTNRVSSFAEIYDADIVEAVDADTLTGVTYLSSSDVKTFNSSVVGVAIVYQYSDPMPIVGSSSVTANLNVSLASSGTVIGIDRVFASNARETITSYYSSTGTQLTSTSPLYPTSSWVNGAGLSPDVYTGDVASPAYGIAGDGVFIGIGEVIDGDEFSPGERVAFTDSQTVPGLMNISTLEGATFVLVGEINGISQSGSPASGGTFYLDDSPLDAPTSLLDLKFGLNLDTVENYPGLTSTSIPDAPGKTIIYGSSGDGVCTGQATIRGFIDEEGSVTGVAEIKSNIPDSLGAITSRGYFTGYYSSTGFELTSTSSLYPTTSWINGAGLVPDVYTGDVANPIYGLSGDGVSIGESYSSYVSSVIRLEGESNASTLVTEGLSEFILNAPNSIYNETETAFIENKTPDIAFRYTISAVEIYTYVPALAGYVNGMSMLPGPTGPTGPVAPVGEIVLSVKRPIIGVSNGASAVAGRVIIPRSFYDNIFPTGPTGTSWTPGIYDTGEYS